MYGLRRTIRCNRTISPSQRNSSHQSHLPGGHRRPGHRRLRGAHAAPRRQPRAPSSWTSTSRCPANLSTSSAHPATSTCPTSWRASACPCPRSVAWWTASWTTASPPAGRIAPPPGRRRVDGRGREFIDRFRELNARQMRELLAVMDNASCPGARGPRGPGAQGVRVTRARSLRPVRPHPASPPRERIPHASPPVPSSARLQAERHAPAGGGILITITSGNLKQELLPNIEFPVIAVSSLRCSAVRGRRRHRAG